MLRAVSGLCRPGSGPFRSPLFRLDVAAIDDRPPPLDLASRTEARQQQRVQLLPDPGLLPLIKPAPAGVARPVAELLRQMHPRGTRVQHEQDPLQRLTVRQPLAARIARRAASGNNGSTSPHNSSDTTHGASQTPAPPHLDDGCRRPSPSGTRSLHSAIEFLAVVSAALLTASAVGTATRVRGVAQEAAVAKSIASHGITYAGRHEHIARAHCRGLPRYGVKRSGSLDYYHRLTCNLTDADRNIYEANVQITRSSSTGFFSWQILSGTRRFHSRGDTRATSRCFPEPALAAPSAATAAGSPPLLCHRHATRRELRAQAPTPPASARPPLARACRPSHRGLVELVRPHIGRRNLFQAELALGEMRDPSLVLVDPLRMAPTGEG